MKLCVKCNLNHKRPGRVCGKCIYKARDLAKDKQAKKQWYLQNKEKILKNRKEKYVEDKLKILSRNKNYRKANKEKMQSFFKEYNKKNRKKLNSYRKNKYKNDVNFKLSTLIRSRINKVLKKQKTIFHKSIQELGCSLEELKIYLESKFLNGMTWENHGKWHIDHIVHLCKFNLLDKEQFNKAVHYTNLQPLWALDNLKKNKY